MILIQNATILTVSHGTIEHGSILIKDGKIAEVGTSIKVPKDAQVIDAAGQFVIPGIIDCHSHIAIDGSVNEGSVSVSSIVNIADVLNPDDIDIYRDLAGGVTVANVLARLRKLYRRPDRRHQTSLGPARFEASVRRRGPRHQVRARRESQALQLQHPGRRPRVIPPHAWASKRPFERRFVEARDYKKAWDDYDKRVAAGDKNAIPPRRDLRLDPLVEVLEGKRYVHAHCYREDEILMLLRVAKEFGFKIRTLQHVLEGYKVADEIAAAGTGASTFSDWWAYKVEAYDAIPYNAALMTRRGVLVSVNSDDAEEATHLNQEAAKTMKYGGLSHDEALKLVTINPAIQLGIDKRVGSIDVGKDADLVIYNHDPLSAYAVVQKTLIDGRVYFDRQRDIADREAHEKEKKALMEKEKKAGEKKPDATIEIGKKRGAKPDEKKTEEKPKPPQADAVSGGAL